MGIYNCASTLQEALDSLYSQSFKDFDIILCDDGSSDDTFAVAKNNRDIHSNIILLQNEKNEGLNKTLNHCLGVATGEYIARMDGDDVSLPTRFEKQVAFLDNHPEYAIVSTPMIYFDESGEFGRGEVTPEPTTNAMNYGCPFCHAPCMVRREAYLAVGGYSVSPWLLRYEDYDLWMKMFAAGYKGYNLSEPLYAMRDDRNAVRRRTLKGRINGIYAHWRAYRILNLSLIIFLKFSIVSIVKGLLPKNLYTVLHKKKLSKQLHG